MATSTRVRRGELLFDVTVDGPADGEPILLLHGFPQHASSWDAIVPLLTEQGYRTLAMQQRGYCPGAQPRRRRDYRLPEVAADAAAVIDELAGGRAHVVGHDLGGAAAWTLAAGYPDKVTSIAALSAPHPMAFLSAVARSAQALKSWYMLAFQLPWLPERLLALGYLRLITRVSGQSEQAARRDAAEFAGPASFTGPLNWYRAMPLADPRAADAKVSRPALLIWGDGDVTVTRKAVERCRRYVTGPYRLEMLHGVSHWIPDEVPAEAAAHLLRHVKEYG